MKGKIELLAPAGNVEALHAAVENGADAVYLGGKLFNARMQAGNFDDNQLSEAVKYAHIRGVNVYLTMNTLISGDEMKAALEYAKEAYLMGIDAVIIQDLGFAAALREAVPDLPLHASTQMTIYDKDGVRMLEKLGFKRVVLARELSLEDIKEIAANTNLELEVFCHGALCVCYSGQCLMSSLIGGRSGNRGKCAQPCRLPYSLVPVKPNDAVPDLESCVGCGRAEAERSSKRNEVRKYILSTKDLCTLGILDKLADSGIGSLKIEGRMKSAEYVSIVVRTYRKYIDALPEGLDIDQNDMKALMQAYNRGGFTEGYLTGKKGIDLMSIENPENQGVYIGKVISSDKAAGTAEIKLEEDLSVGDGIEIWNRPEESSGAVVSSIKVNGKIVKNAGKGATARIGTIRGNIPKGAKVYKTFDRNLNKSAKDSFAGHGIKKIELTGIAVIAKERPFYFLVRDDEGNEVWAESASLPEKAVKTPISAERVYEQLIKTGSTPFVFKELKVEIKDDGLSLPVSEINDTRRKALSRLEEIRGGRHIFKRNSDEVEESFASALGRIKAVDKPVSGKPGAAAGGLNRGPVTDGMSFEPKARRPNKLTLYFFEMRDGLDYAGLGADRLYLPARIAIGDKGRRITEKCSERGIETYLWFPAVTRGGYNQLLKDIARETKARNLNIDGILIGNPGSIEAVLQDLPSGLKVAADLPFNVYNAMTLKALAEMGLDGVTLSAELTLKQAIEIARHAEMLLEPDRLQKTELEAVVFGRIPLMTSEYCPVGSIEGNLTSEKPCPGCCRSGRYSLKDRKGMEFPVLCDNMTCRITILNSLRLFVPEVLQKLADCGVNAFRLYMLDEGEDEIKNLIKLYRNYIEYGKAADERMDEEAARIKAAGFTKGHYFRGV